MTIDQGLKACPFCGCGDKVSVGKPALSRLLAVYCEYCEIHGPKAGSREAAIELWNDRTPSPSLPSREAIAEALGGYASTEDFLSVLSACRSSAERAGLFEVGEELRRARELISALSAAPGEGAAP